MDFSWEDAGSYIVRIRRTEVLRLADARRPGAK